VLAVERINDTLCVRIRGASGKAFVVELSGVRIVNANKPEGMMLYASVEMSSQPPLRRFAFANWDHDDDAFLQIDAESFVVRDG
jgi:hypothetical protein